MRYRPQYSTKKRDELWSRECLCAHLAGRGRLPICNLCDIVVNAGADWHESHDPAQPRVFGGKSVGIAHALCNILHGVTVVKPQVTRSNRIRDVHLGLKGPGLGPCPMRAGRRSPFTKTMRHGMQPRRSSSEKLAETLAKRAFVTSTGVPA